MELSVLFYKIPKFKILPFNYIEIDGEISKGVIPDIIVTNFEILKDEDEKEILNYLRHKIIYIHTGSPDKKPFYSNHSFNPEWKEDSLKWFGLKVLNDFLLLKATSLSGFEEFINAIRKDKNGFFSIKCDDKRVSFILKDGKILYFSHSETELMLGNLLQNSQPDLKFDINEKLNMQYLMGNFLGKILVEENIIEENFLKEILRTQLERIAEIFGKLKNPEYFYFPDIKIEIKNELDLNFSHFLNAYLKYFNQFPARKPLFLLRDTVVKAEGEPDLKEISLSPMQYYLLNEAKNPVEIKKLFYIVPGEEREKERALTFLYSLSLISIVKEGERLNPFEEVVKLAKEKDKMNFYELLGVAQDASEEDIRKAYFEAAKKFHPDKFSSFPEFFSYRNILEDFFATINQAYQILSNKEERKKYDLELKGEKKKEFDPREKARELLAEAKKAISAKQNALAIQKLSEIIYLKQEDWKVLQLLGKLYIEENKLKEAENFLRKSLTLDDRQYETYNLLGDLYLKAGLKHRAIKEYQKAIEINPANMEAKEKLNELL